MLPTSLLLCLLISKGASTVLQPTGPMAEMFSWHAEACAIPTAFDILTPVFSFFIFPRIALFQSYFTTPVARLSSAEASKAFLKSRVSPAHSFHLPECLITPRADDGPASRSPGQEPELSQTQFWHREPQNHPILLLLGCKSGT